MAYENKWVKNGNIKIGNSMWSYSKLAGNGILGGCKGTCGKHCKGCYNSKNPKKSPCYVFNSYNHYGWEKSTVMRAHIRNTNAMRNDIDKAFKDLELQLRRCHKKPSTLRIHASGELESSKELEKWFELAKKFPNTPFYIYTKNYEVVNDVLGRRIKIPSNFFLNISIWHNSGIDCYKKWKDTTNVRAYVYCDGYDYDKHGLHIDKMCPAYNKEGKMDHRFTCDKCKLCFKKINKVIGCYDH